MNREAIPCGCIREGGAIPCGCIREGGAIPCGCIREGGSQPDDGGGRGGGRGGRRGRGRGRERGRGTRPTSDTTQIVTNMVRPTRRPACAAVRIVGLPLRRGPRACDLVSIALGRAWLPRSSKSRWTGTWSAMRRGSISARAVLICTASRSECGGIVAVLFLE